MTLSEAYERFEAVHDELAAMSFSVDFAGKAVRLDPTLLRASKYELRPIMLARANELLDATYTLRLFAEFETVLREYLASIRPSPRPRRTRMEILINRIGTARHISHGVIHDVHEIREYRNSLVHNTEARGRLDYLTCEKRINHYVSYLPREW